MAARISHKSWRSSVSRSRLMRILATGMAVPVKMAKMVMAAISSMSVSPRWQCPFRFAATRFRNCNSTVIILPRTLPMGSAYNLDCRLSSQVDLHQTIGVFGDSADRCQRVIAGLVEQEYQGQYRSLSGHPRRSGSADGACPHIAAFGAMHHRRRLAVAREISSVGHVDQLHRVGVIFQFKRKIMDRGRA